MCSAVPDLVGLVLFQGQEGGGCSLRCGYSVPRCVRGFPIEGAGYGSEDGGYGAEDGGPGV